MTNYANGANKERKIVNKLKAEGYAIAFRSAGSHSPIDCVAIHKNRTIKFIQSKPKKYGKKAAARLQEENDWLNGSFECTFEVR